MHIDRLARARLPGRLAMIFNLAALVVIVGLLALGEPAVRSVAGSVMRVAGLSAGGSSVGVFVDSGGQIRYRSRSVTLDDLTAAISRDLEGSRGGTVSVTADARADSAVVARVLRAAGRGGAETVNLSMAQ
jgi:biopolymer transport protein ExbD